VVVERLEYDEPVVLQAISMDALRLSRFVPIHWWPTVGGTVHEAVPLAIRSALEEAATTLGAGCYRAATIMARHALEAVTKDQGATKSSLADRLKEMVAAHKLQPNLAEWATEVRLVGNAGAHNPLAAVPREDAEDLLDFMRDLVNYLYVLPFELVERRKKKSAAP
jgi:glutamate-1-semialdehyde aminotransferase